MLQIKVNGNQVSNLKNVIDRLKINEGYRSKVYKCSLGYDTIGYGFAIKDLELSEEISTKILTDLVIKKHEYLKEKWMSLQYGMKH